MKHLLNHSAILSFVGHESSNVFASKTAKCSVLKPVDSPYLNVAEAANFLGYSQTYLYKLTSRGKIPCHNPSGGRLFFLKEELERWVKQGSPSIETDIDDRAADYLLRNRKQSQKKKKK